MTDFAPGSREFLLALADDKHLMGQQHAEWIGVAPFLEEDLAFCSIGQDELGHAASVYELLINDADRSDETSLELAVDALAFGRSADAYRSCWLVETAMPDWADTLVRHWMFDAADELRWSLISEGTNADLRDTAARVAREETYHRMHADGLLDVLMNDDTAGSVMREAVSRIAPLALGMFDPVPGETQAIADGLASGPLADQQPSWQNRAEERFGPIDWTAAPAQHGRTVRSGDFEPLLARMREVIELDPGAVW